MDLAVNEPLTEETADLRDLADSIGFMARLAQVHTYETFFEDLGAYGLRPGEFSTLLLIGRNPGIRQGMVAQILAATRPARVSSLTAIMTSTNHPRLPVARFDVLWRMAGLGPRPQTREAVIRRTTGMLQRVGSPGYPTPLDYRRRLAGRAYDRAFRPRGVARQTHAIVATGSFEPLLADIRAPTQVVHGLADPLLRPACGQRCAQVIPGARLELVAGMGHDFALPLMPRWAELIGDNAGRA